MRNLSLLSISTAILPSANIIATTVDVDENVIYAASEQKSPEDDDVTITIWKIGSSSANGLQPESTAIATLTLTLIASVPSLPPSVTLKVLLENRQLVVLTRGGDIVSIPIDDETHLVEMEGSIDHGISAASWSPDDSFLAIVTGDEKLILMTSSFDVLSETYLHPKEFGEAAPINVGWGSKQTQFHGSLGKTAAQAPSIAAVGSSPDDDGLPRISWRGDGAFFVVSTLSPLVGGMRHRILRVYDRQGSLQSTSEAVAGLEHTLSWRPSGSLIAATQRFGFEGGGSGKQGRHDIVFFERNGLRHGEFSVRVEEMGSNIKGDAMPPRKWGYKIRELCWSSDSNVLALWVEHDEHDVVQLWAVNNYHWYLKQEVTTPSTRFSSVIWHPEKELHLLLATQTNIQERVYIWDTYASLSPPPGDSGNVAVVDGSQILLTPFRSQNIPPPMSSHQLDLSDFSPRPSLRFPRVPVHTSFSRTTDSLAVLWDFGYVEVWALHTRLGPGREKIMNPSKSWFGVVADTSIECRQIYLRDPSSIDGMVQNIVVLGTNGHHDIIIFSSLQKDDSSSPRKIHQLPSSNGRLIETQGAILWQSTNGEIMQCDAASDGIVPVAQFQEFCPYALGVSNPDSRHETVFIGRGKTGKLFLANASGNKVLASNATSFTTTPGFVIFTTSAHEAKFVPLNTLPNLIKETGDVNAESWETRRLERGSRIVVAVPSTMSLVLQMPRGNLETINPRPLVMEVVKQDLSVGDYRKAFFACRKHRIDLNVLVEHDEAAFLRDISSFVEHIPEVDHLNLFLTSIGRSSHSPETISRICDALRMDLEARDLKKYVNSILTAYVVKSPPDYEAGLALLLRLKASESEIVEEAVKYIIFLVDAERLFDIALGMYDFSLVLMIAQHAQKDPREYLPFLRELRALEKYYQRFKIDDHLKRHESALRNLSMAGPDRFEEALDYVDRHKLYEASLRIWSDTNRYEAVLERYGDWLFERREFTQAALVFVEAKNVSKAMVAYEKALEWQELFELAILSSVPAEGIVDMGFRVAEDLSSKKRYAEAARVLLDYSRDVRGAIIALVQGNHFSEARRIISLRSVPELLEDIVYPGAFESQAQFLEDLGEMKDQLRKQRVRIQELRVKKVEQPDEFYGNDDVNLHNVDAMTDASMAPTAFTRYTVAATATSQSSKRSSRSKRKLERKVGSGRKGTADEEEYLLKSITKLVARFSATQEESKKVLPHLLQFTPQHRADGAKLQKEMVAFELALKEAVEEVWARPTGEEDGAVPADSWATRMEEKEKDKRVNPINKVEKPMMTSGKEWRVGLLDSLDS